MHLSNKQFVGDVSYYADGSGSYPVTFSYAQDLNADGVDEVIFAGFETQPNTPSNYNNTQVSIFGWKDGAFQNLTGDWFSPGSNRVEGVGDIAFGDFDGNGTVDMFLTAYTDMDHPVNAYALMNNGQSLNRVNLGPGLWMHAAAAGDINRDGYVDVVPTGYNGDIPTYLGSRSGLVPYHGMTGGSGVALGDFLGDGSITGVFVDAGNDIADTYLVSFEVNASSRTVARNPIAVLPQPRLGLVDEGNSHDIRARAFDFSGDGLLDVLVFSYQYDTNASDPHKSEIQFLKNLGHGNFADVTDTYRVGFDPSGYVGYTPQIVDVNRDGRLDIFTSNRDWMPEYKSTTLLLQTQGSQFVDFQKETFTQAVGSQGVGLVASGPNGSVYLISEGPWQGGSGVPLYIQEMQFPERDAAEYLTGTISSNRIFAFAGDDTVEAGYGFDTVYGGLGNDYIQGGYNGDQIFGEEGNDDLRGGNGLDMIIGGVGNDTIRGAKGTDTLTGGDGADVFIFEKELDGTINVDTITDFVSGVDRIELSSAIFGSAGGIGSNVGLSQYITYNAATGVLSYDQDGTAAGAAKAFAVLGTDSHPTGVGSDFWIVA